MMQHMRHTLALSAPHQNSPTQNATPTMNSLFPQFMDIYIHAYTPTTFPPVASFPPDATFPSSRQFPSTRQFSSQSPSAPPPLLPLLSNLWWTPVIPQSPLIRRVRYKLHSSVQWRYGVRGVVAERSRMAYNYLRSPVYY